MEIRGATMDDLDFIVQTQVAAFPDDPQWNYRYPRCEEFPEDTYHHTKICFKSFLAAPNKFTVMVACSQAIEDSTIMKLVAHAVWVTKNIQNAANFDEGRKNSLAINIEEQENHIEQGEMRDTNPKHVEAFTKAFVKARQKYFDDVYGPKQVRLMILGTHPDYRRRGAATALCKWGMILAYENKMATSVFGSPMGTKLYTSLGFKFLGKVTVQVEGEEEKFYSSAMVYEFRP